MNKKKLFEGNIYIDKYYNWAYVVDKCIRFKCTIIINATYFILRFLV